MRKIAVVALVLIAALAGTASAASAHKFVVSKTGKITSTPKSGASGTIQYRFNGFVVECKEAGTGEITALSSETFKETVTYSGCIGGGSDLKASAAHFEYNANGTAKIEKTFYFEVEGAGCEYVIPPQTIANFAYENVSGKLATSLQVTDLVVKGTGGECGAEQKQDVYSGTLLATLAGGTLKWE